MLMRTQRKYVTIIALIIACNSALISQITHSIDELLVSTAWLEEHLNDSLLLILHYGMKTEYKKEHIPGSRFVSIWDILVKDEAGVRHELPDSEVLEKVLRSWGIQNNSRIIICYQDGNAIPMAARLFYTLDYGGFGSQTSLLNGGMKAWKEEGRALTREVEAFPEGNADVRINEEVRITKEEVISNLDRGGVSLVDARPYERYAGIEEGSDNERHGHIPGALNIPFHETTTADSSHFFKSTEDLHRLFQDHLKDQDSLLITYCGTGIWASTLYFTARLLGYRVRLYDGSFQEWEQDETLPVSGSN